MNKEDNDIKFFLALNTISNLDIEITLQFVAYEIMGLRIKNKSKKAIEAWLEYGKLISKKAQYSHELKQRIMQRVSPEEQKLIEKSSSWELTSLGFPGLFKFEKKK